MKRMVTGKGVGVRLNKFALTSAPGLTLNPGQA